MSIPIPPPREADTVSDRQFATSIIENRLLDLERAWIDKYPKTTAYTPLRTLTPATATVADVANFLVTLVEDLRNAGKISQ